jgi:hypothetical protein
VANQYWERRSPITHEMYMFAISVSVATYSFSRCDADDGLACQAGLLAGEGMGGVAQAMLSILKLDGGRELVPLSSMLSKD